MSNEIPMISLVKRGSKTFPRYVLAKADEYKNAVYWDGSTWSQDESKAILYENITECLWVHHDLMIESVSDLPCHRFVAPLYIEVYGVKPKLTDLRAWLEKAVRIVAKSPENGQNDTWALLILDSERTKSA